MTTESEVSVTADVQLAPGDDATLRYSPGTDSRILSLLNAHAASHGAGVNHPNDVDMSVSVDTQENVKPVNVNATLDSGSATGVNVDSGPQGAGTQWTSLPDAFTRRLPVTIAADSKTDVVINLRHSERSGAAETYTVLIGMGAATTLEVAK